MPPEQLVLNLPVRKADGREDFFVTPSNEHALRQIENWRNWAGGKLVLVGPEGAGKSHLTAVWTHITGAVCIAAKDVKGFDLVEINGAVALEDVDRLIGDTDYEEAFFHLHNHVMNLNAPLLMSARDGMGSWPFVLPDLKSRILASDMARLGPPDDGLLSAVLIKLFADRQLNISPKVISYIVTHMDRSFAVAQEIVARIDLAAMSTHKKISTRLASDIIKEMR